MTPLEKALADMEAKLKAERDARAEAWNAAGDSDAKYLGTFLRIVEDNEKETKSCSKF